MIAPHSVNFFALLRYRSKKKIRLRYQKNNSRINNPGHFFPRSFTGNLFLSLTTVKVLRAYTVHQFSYILVMLLVFCVITQRVKYL